MILWWQEISFMPLEQQETMLQRALYLIKFNITDLDNTQNRMLHEAVQLIVSVAREQNLLMK